MRLARNADTDLFAQAMVGQNASLDDFLRTGPSDPTHYLLVAPAASTLSNTIDARLDRLRQTDPDTADAWTGRLHFATNFSDAVPGAIMDQWPSPDNRLRIGGAVAGRGRGAERKTPTEAAAQEVAVSAAVVDVRRLDCRYTWCRWPGENDAFQLTALDLTAACAATRNITGKPSYVLVRASATCSPAEAVAAAMKAGAVAGVVVRQMEGTMVEAVHGAPGSSAAAVVTMVDAAGGDALEAALTTAGGSVNGSLATEALPGHFMALDRRGRLAEVGWEKYATLRMLVYEGEWLAYRAGLDALLSLPALVVPVATEASVGGGAIHAVAMPAISTIRAAKLDVFEVDFTLSCDGDMDRDCSVWDRVLTLFASCESQLRGVAAVDAAPMEVARWINPFQRWVVFLATPCLLLCDSLSLPVSLLSDYSVSACLLSLSLYLLLIIHPAPTPCHAPLVIQLIKYNTHHSSEPGASGGG